MCGMLHDGRPNLNLAERLSQSLQAAFDQDKAELGIALVAHFDTIYDRQKDVHDEHAEKIAELHEEYAEKIEELYTALRGKAVEKKLYKQESKYRNKRYLDYKKKCDKALKERFILGCSIGFSSGVVVTAAGIFWLTYKR
jgi:hypothetical protein